MSSTHPGERFHNTFLVNKASFAATMDLVMRPSRSFVRIVQSLDLSDANPAMSTRLEFSLPTQGASEALQCLVPIAFVRKIGLSELLTIESSPFVIAPVTLGSSATNLISAAILRAYAGTLSVANVDRKLVTEACTKIPALPKDKAREIYTELDKHLTEAYAGLTRSEPIEFLQAARRFVGRRPLFVPCSAEHGIAYVEFSQLYSRAELRSDNIVEAARFAFGRTPYKPRIDISYASYCESYHLRITAPHLHYVKRVRLKRHTTTDRGARSLPSANLEQLPHDPGISGVAPDASGYLHLQARGLAVNPHARKGISCELTIAEQPFGGLGVAATRLAVALCVAIVLTILGGTLAVNPIQTLSALLLALPGVLGVNLFVARQPDGARHGAVHPRFLSAIAAGSAITSSVLLAAWTISANRYMSGLRPRDIRDLHEYIAPSWVSRILEILIWLDSIALIGAIALLVANFASFRGALKGMSKQYKTTP